MMKRKFWPLDYDPDGEIYENVSWDLPGYRRRQASGMKSTRPSREPGRA